MSARWNLVWGSMFCGLSVALGALAAHALADVLGDGASAIADRWLGVAALLFVAGIALFSGSLYVLALGGPRIFGPVTPVGGLLFLVGWVVAASGFFRSVAGAGS